MTPKRVFGIAAILLALASWIGSAAIALSAFQSQAQWQAPGSTSVQLAVGKWSIFQKLPTDSTAITPSDVAAARTVKVEQVMVTDPSGISVPLTCSYCSTKGEAAIPLDLQLANSIADFSVSTAGTYLITVKDATGQMAVANPVTSLESVMGQVMVLGALGGVLIAVGVVLIIRGRTPGGTSQPPSAGASVAQPPGWYQNPYLPDSDSQMWWDGTKWTSNWR